MKYLKNLKIFRVIFLFLSGCFFLGEVFAEVYKLENTIREKGAEIQSEERVFLKLKFEEDPSVDVPVFLYQIEEVKGPYKVTDRVFKESLLLLEKGNNFFSQRDYVKAIGFYKKSLEINPSFISAYHNMGLAYFLLGRYNQSIDNFETVVKLKPLDPYPYFYLGWIYKRLENFRLAQQYLEEARKIAQSVSDRILLKNIEELLSRVRVEEFEKN